MIPRRVSGYSWWFPRKMPKVNKSLPEYNICWIQLLNYCLPTYKKGEWAYVILVHTLTSYACLRKAFLYWANSSWTTKSMSYAKLPAEIFSCSDPFSIYIFFGDGGFQQADLALVRFGDLFYSFVTWKRFRDFHKIFFGVFMSKIPSNRLWHYLDIINCRVYYNLSP